jgi:hypothetical protein
MSWWKSTSIVMARNNSPRLCTIGENSFVTYFVTIYSLQTFFEAISIGNLQSALMRFQEMGIIEKQVRKESLVGSLISQAINEKGTSVIKLAKEFQKKSNFRAAVEHLGKFRRFGKYKKEPNFSKQLRKLAKGIVSSKQRAKL